MLSTARKYLQQIGNKYYGYFSDPAHLEEMQKRAGDHGVTVKNLKFEYALLMGRDEDKDLNKAVVHAELGTLHSKVRLFTYDDLIRRHHYLHLRVSRFGIND